MPLYEYKCDSCNSVFEVMQKFSDAPLSVHESCGGRVERLLSSPALQFKGSGWYITDYARNGGNGKSSEPAKAAKSDSSSGGTSESKPAPATSESKP